MKIFLEELNMEIKKLEEAIQKLKRNLEKYPEGSLQINHSNGCVQYYYNNPRSRYVRPQYIKKENCELVQKLAQKDYDTKLLKRLEERLKVAKKTFAVYNKTDLEEIFYKYTKDRQRLLIPRYISDEDYAKKWEDISYQRKTFAEGTAEIYTVKGERVRSKSEKIIADALERNNVPYKYECPLELTGGRVIHPDFTVLNKRTRKEFYWEHLGMMDDVEYARNAVRRIEEMGRNGIMPGKNLLITAETKVNPINVTIVDMIIQEYLQNKLEDVKYE